MPFGLKAKARDYAVKRFLERRLPEMIDKVRTLATTKTGWWGAIVAGYGVMTWLVEDDQQRGMEYIMLGLGMIFARDAIAKVEKK